MRNSDSLSKLHRQNLREKYFVEDLFNEDVHFNEEFPDIKLRLETFADILFYLCCFCQATSKSAKDEDKLALDWVHKVIRNITQSRLSISGSSGSKAFSTNVESFITTYEMFTLYQNIDAIDYEQPYTKVLKKIAYSNRNLNFPINALLCKAATCENVYQKIFSRKNGISQTSGEHVMLLQRKETVKPDVSDTNSKVYCMWFVVTPLYAMYLALLFSAVAYHTFHRDGSLVRFPEQHPFFLGDINGTAPIFFEKYGKPLNVIGLLFFWAVPWLHVFSFFGLYCKNQNCSQDYECCVTFFAYFGILGKAVFLGYVSYLFTPVLFWVTCGMGLKPMNAVPLVSSIVTFVLLILRWRSKYIVHDDNVASIMKDTINKFFEKLTFRTHPY